MKKLTLEQFKEEITEKSAYEFYKTLKDGSYMQETFKDMYLGQEELEEERIKEILEESIFESILVYEGDVCITENLALTEINYCKDNFCNAIFIKGNFTVEGDLEIHESGYFFVDGHLTSDAFIYGEDYVFVNGDIVVKKVAYIGDENALLHAAGALKTPYILFVADKCDFANIEQGISKDAIAIVGKDSYGISGDINLLKEQKIEACFLNTALAQSNLQGGLNDIFELINLIKNDEFKLNR